MRDSFADFAREILTTEDTENTEVGRLRQGFVGQGVRMSEVRGRRTEDRGQRSEVGSRRTEDRGRRSAVGGRGCWVVELLGCWVVRLLSC